MKKKFDFSRFAFREDGQTQATTVPYDPPPKPDHDPAIIPSSDEEQSNDGQFQTRSGRRVQPKVAVVLDSSESSEEENEEDAFKTSVRPRNRLNGKAKPAKRKTKAVRDELDMSKEFVALRKSNKSITVENPLKSINNKLSNFEIANEKQSLSDEINLLLGTDESNQSYDSRSKKRKAVK